MIREELVMWRQIVLPRKEHEYSRKDSDAIYVIRYIGGKRGKKEKQGREIKEQK